MLLYILISVSKATNRFKINNHVTKKPRKPKIAVFTYEEPTADCDESLNGNERHARCPVNPVEIVSPPVNHVTLAIYIQCGKHEPAPGDTDSVQKPLCAASSLP